MDLGEVNSMRRVAIALFLIAIALPARAHKIRRSAEPAPHRSEAEPARFDPEEASRQVRARMGMVRACYERASRREPDIEGKLQLGLDISEVGQVTAVRVEVDGLRTAVNRSAANELTGCIRNQALGWRLAPEGPVGGAHLSYVFVFAAAN